MVIIDIGGTAAPQIVLLPSRRSALPSSYPVFPSRYRPPARINQLLPYMDSIPKIEQLSTSSASSSVTKYSIVLLNIALCY